MSKESTNKGLALHWKVIIGLILGVIYAWMSVEFGWNEFTLKWIQPFGDIFINLLKLIAVPLVLFSIISGVASLGDMKKLGRMGVKTLAIYLTTTMFAVIVGLTLVNIFKPGTHASETLREDNRIRYELWRDANDITRLDNINISELPEFAEKVVVIQGEVTEANEWVSDKLNKAENTKNSGPLQPLVDVVPKNIFQSLSDMQMLQIIFFAIFFGIVVTGLQAEQKKTVVKAVDALNEVFIQMVWVVMKAMPIFVFALMAGQIVKAAGSDPEHFQQLLTFLLYYSVVVVLG
ncbi:MAG: dicarboxylate/amino acid:cation symporter, partial [Flavobacteriales bacterium]